ncbi:hypothetical protein GOODEAATRI_002452 [Goodea atripinnis]|uniref:Microtubule-associated protein 1 light chain 3 gamma n=1 Tax=Goodea atripinnis TaxID=208336 RepID=A0ABV0P0V3_9TELE
MAPFEKSMEMMPFKQRKCLGKSSPHLLDSLNKLTPLTSDLFVSSLRNKIALDQTQTVFLLVAERSMSCMSSSMGEIYSRFRDADGFLYITYASQEVFGAPPSADTPL